MKKILVPTDFSECSLRAEEMAIDLARHYESEVHFLHSVHSNVDWVQISLDEEKQYPETRALINEARATFDEYEEKFKGLKIKTFIRFNETYEDIIHHAEENGNDLIVMGSNGESGWTKKMILGSNTRKVLESSRVPVLVVKC